MKQNKTRTYILYALGEILLVVFGILIALQINNWNEEANLKMQEINMLNSLQLENAENKMILTDCIEDMNEDISTGDKLQKLLGPKISNIENDSLNYILGALGSSGRCQIQTDVIDELRNSGTLKIIQNQDLRRAISKWSTSYNEVKEEEESWEGQLSDHFLTYTNKWISWNDVDIMFGFGDSTFTGSTFDYDPNKMLQEFEFANQLNNLRWRMRRVTERLEIANRQLRTTDSLITVELR